MLARDCYVTSIVTSKVMLPPNAGETSKAYENGKGGRRQYGEKNGLEGEVRGGRGRGWGGEVI